MSNKEVLVRDMVIGRQDNKRKEQRDAEMSAKQTNKQKNITSVLRTDLCHVKLLGIKWNMKSSQHLVQHEIIIVDYTSRDEI